MVGKNGVALLVQNIHIIRVLESFCCREMPRWRSHYRAFDVLRTLVRCLSPGFKLFTRDTAAVVFGSLHLQRWAFDIEMIYICQLLGIPMAVREGRLGIVC